MRNAVVFFVCLTVPSFLSTSPSRAYPGGPISTLAHHRAPIVAASHRHDDNDDIDDDDIDDDDLDDAPPPRRNPYPPPPPEAVPAFEFLPPPRPANCGEFRYWNGEYCADARDQPPYTGPRW